MAGNVKYLKYAKWAVFISCLLASSFNLADAISKGESILSILFYSGILFILSTVLVVIPGKAVLICVILVVGSLTLISAKYPLELSGAGMFFIIANSIVKNIYVKTGSYFTVVLIVLYKHIIDGLSVTSALNMMLAYAAIFFIAEMFFKYIRGENSGHQKQ